MNINEITWQYITAHAEDDVARLALHPSKDPQVDMAVALQQIAGRQKAKEKLPEWYATEGILYPKKVSMEQCSSSQTADYKASLVEGDSFADFKTYRTIGEGVAGLDTGNFDALIIDEIAARYEISKHPDLFETVEVTVGYSTEFGIGFRKGNTELRDKVQTAFNAIVKDGTAKQISEKWFQSDLIKLRR